VNGTKRTHYGKEKEQFCDERDGKKYVYVTIGTQTWMAENLNYSASGSKCYGNLNSNCDRYGRLYEWAMAMDIEPKSGYRWLESDEKHQGICPSGWYIPNNKDWDKLMRHIDGNTGTSNPYDSHTAGKHLKTTTGWNSYSGIVNLDTYGFSALPGGGGLDDGRFVAVGEEGNWWSSSEVNVNAYLRAIFHDEDVAYYYADPKSFSCAISVRCLKNN
jgi:uncharacterized protein (TIGR02145 family)